jgi:RimJ/RimL family protein N-acetyltransferase
MGADHVVYRATVQAPLPTLPKPEGYSFELWEPSLFDVVPTQAPRATYAVWWLFHASHVFHNRKYRVVLAWKGAELAHRLGVFPGYFRFPFMGKDDLQIGDVWTAPQHRGRGLAAYAIRFAMASCTSDRPCTCWYLSRAENVASIRAAERAGFRYHSPAARTRRAGLRLFGAFELTSADNTAK